MSTNTATPFAKTGFYRATSGWVAYCKALGITRPATQDEARNQDKMTDG